VHKDLAVQTKELVVNWIKPNTHTQTRIDAQTVLQQVVLFVAACDFACPMNHSSHECFGSLKLHGCCLTSLHAAFGQSCDPALV
jgi:hypothetical protein